jgi:hypothetical protein
VTAPLVQRHRALPGARGARLAAARELAADPRPLVRDLLAGPESAGPPVRFHTAPRPLVRELSEIADGQRAATAADFAFWLAREGGLTVAGEPLLDCRYVDRELALGGPGPGRLRLDVLLVNAHDRAPVLAEVKLGGDKDAFAALVQLLACASLLAGPGGGERLRAAYPQAGYAAGALDAMVLLVEPRWRAADWTELLIAARELARGVTADAAASGRVRRITFLTVARRAGSLWVDAERL